MTNIKIKTHVVKQLPTERPLEKGAVYKVEQPNGDLLTYTIDSSGNPVLERGITNDQNARLERMSSEQISKVESITTGDITKLKEDYTKEEIDQQFNAVRNLANSSRINLNGATVLPVPPRRPDNTVIEDAWAELSQGVTYTQTGGDPITGIEGNRSIAEWNNEDGEWVLVDMGALPTTPTVDVAEQGNTNAISSDGAYKELKPINITLDSVTTRNNYFDKSKRIAGQLLNTAGAPTGKLLITANASWDTSVFIKVTKGWWTFTLDGPININGRFVAVFDSPLDTEGTRVTGSNSFEITSDEAWVLANVKSNTEQFNLDLFQLEKGQVATPVQPYGSAKVNNDAVDKANKAESGNTLPITSDGVYNEIQPFNSLITRVNFFNKELSPIQGVMLASGGAIPAEQVRMTQTSGVNAWSMFAPIKVTKGWWTIQFDGNINLNPWYAGLFTSDDIGNDIFGQKITSKTFYVEADEAWFVMNAGNGTISLNPDIIQLEKGQVATEYKPYTDIFIDSNKVINTGGGSSPSELGLSIVVQPNNVLIRTDYDGVNDLIRNYQYNQATNINGNFSAYETYIVPKNVSTEANLTSYMQHRTNDSISALSVDPYWFILGQHGYEIPRATSAGNTFTVGQMVKNESGGEFEVIYKTGNFIFLAPKITVAGNNITRSWVHNGTFSSLSLLDDSYTATVTAVTNYQIKPMLDVEKQGILLDGKPITEQGSYSGNTVELFDRCVFINPIDADFDLGGSVKMSGDPLIEVTQSYYFKGLSTYSSTNINMKDWLPFNRYHGIQPLGLMTLGDYKPYIMIPKVNPKTTAGRTAVDWNNPTDISLNSSTQYAQYLYANNSSDLIDPTDIPDRTIQFHRNSINQLGLGFAAGLDLESGLTSKENRPLFTGEAFGFSQGTSTNNKTYFRVLTSDKFTNGVLPSSFFGQFNAYFAYYVPKENLQSYVVHAKDVSYVYIHTQAVFDKAEIGVDNIEGMKLEVVEQNNIELLSDRVIDGKIYIKSNDVNSNYLVLKTY